MSDDLYRRVSGDIAKKAAEGALKKRHSTPDPVTVFVRRHPADWQQATYLLSDLQRLHWDSVSGGVGRRTSSMALFGYVWCDGAIEGEVAHSCQHGPPPHMIKVCLPKTLNKEHWKRITALAPPR